MGFKDKETNIRKLCNKAKSLTLETILVKSQKKIDIVDLCVEERNFIRYLLDKSNCDQSGRNIRSQCNNSNHNWKIRLKDKEFSIWLRNYNTRYLFFNGTSKSNPRTAGAGGIIYNANGDIKITYEWGLGPLSNNMAEALALYQGLIQLQNLGINTAMVLGDLAAIVSLMVYNRSTSNVLLQQTINRCQVLTHKMIDIHFFHVLRSLNKEADTCANRACTRSIGSLLCNSIESHSY